MNELSRAHSPAVAPGISAVWEEAYSTMPWAGVAPANILGCCFSEGPWQAGMRRGCSSSRPSAPSPQPAAAGREAPQQVRSAAWGWAPSVACICLPLQPLLLTGRAAVASPASAGLPPTSSRHPGLLLLRCSPGSHGRPTCGLQGGHLK